jgi:hypothetical protein
MSYTLVKKSLDNKDELLNELIERVKSKRVAIIGGHFLLYYNQSKDELEPLILDDLSENIYIELAKNYAGNFPELSFEYSIELYHSLCKKNIQSKIILLVNDHKFQDGNYQSNIEEQIADKAGDLRKQFYSKNEIPNKYSDMLAKYGLLDKDVIYLHDNQTRTKEDLLPKESFYFSEQKLRNRFDKYVKPGLIKKNLIYQSINGKRVDLYYDMPSMGCEISITEEGTCGCSAEVIELINNLRQKEFDEIIFFVPHECSIAVENGIMAALNINSKKLKVITIEGLGGMKQNVHNTNKYSITEQNYE